MDNALTVQVLEADEHLLYVDCCQGFAKAAYTGQEALKTASVDVLKDYAQELTALNSVDVFDDVAVVQSLKHVDLVLNLLSYVFLETVGADELDGNTRAIL